MTSRREKRPGVIFRLHSAFVLQHFRQHNGAREEGNAHAALVVRSENFNGPIGRTFDDTHTQRTSERGTPFALPPAADPPSRRFPRILPNRKHVKESASNEPIGSSAVRPAIFIQQPRTRHRTLTSSPKMFFPVASFPVLGRLSLSCMRFLNHSGAISPPFRGHSEDVSPYRLPRLLRARTIVSIGQMLGTHLIWSRLRFSTNTDRIWTGRVAVCRFFVNPIHTYVDICRFSE